MNLDRAHTARPIEGHGYELSAVRESDGYWNSFVDKTAGTTQDLGRIRTTGARDISGDSFVSWTEYSVGTIPTSSVDASYSNMLFGHPCTSAGEGTYTSSNSGKYCQDMSHVALGVYGATQENGIDQ